MEKKYQQRVLNQSINHQITWECSQFEVKVGCADFEAYPRTRCFEQKNRTRSWTEFGDGFYFLLFLKDILGIVENNPIVATEIFKRVHKLPENALKRTWVCFFGQLKTIINRNFSKKSEELHLRIHEYVE